MITNKDIRVENGNLVLNGDKFPLDGQSPEAIMQIVKDNSDTTPTENSTAPITSGGVKNYVDGLITTENVSGRVESISGESDTNVNITLTVPDGYTPIGVAKVITSSRNIAVTGFWINDDNTLEVYLANLYSVALSNVSVSATALYIRS